MRQERQLIIMENKNSKKYGKEKIVKKIVKNSKKNRKELVPFPFSSNLFGITVFNIFIKYNR